MTDITTKTIQISDCNISVAECGAGRPILMLPDNIAGIAYSYRHVQRLFPKRRTFAIDFPGTGGSDKDPTYDQSLTHLAKVVIEVADGLELANFDLVGYGRGSGMARMVAHDHADRLRSLTIMSSIAYDNWPILEMQFAATLQDNMAQAGPMMPVLMPLMVMSLTNMYRAISPAGTMDDQLIRKYTEHFLTPEGMATFVKMCHDATPEELVPYRPQDIRIPTLIMSGARDNVFHPRWSERLYGDIPNSEFALIQDAGFLLFEEQPEAVAQTMERFLARLD